MADFSKEASSMGISKSMAVAVSGLVFAGSAALALGAATPANAQTVTAAPQQLVSDGCCGGRRHSRFHHHNRHHFRHNQRVIVINRNNNFSRSENGQFQRNDRQRQNRDRGRGFFDDED
jgi:hypothetical protein